MTACFAAAARVRSGGVKRSIPLLLAIALLFTACGKRKRVPSAIAPRVGAEETGIASWYGHPYHGRASASGEIYDMEQLTAAHRTLPFGTLVRVENLATGLSVEVRINDRGPFAGGRIIDLSHAAARLLRRDGDPALWRVVVGQEGTEEEAAALAERMRAGGNAGFVVRVDGPRND